MLMKMNNRLTKKICLFINVLFICLCICSCGGKDDNHLSDKKENDTKKMETIKSETEQRTTTDGGGEEGVNISTQKTYEISIIVSENEYLYNDEVTTMDDILDDIKSRNGDVVVTIIDENASYNSYKKLINEFNNNQIEYIEQ